MHRFFFFFPQRCNSGIISRPSPELAMKSKISVVDAALHIGHVEVSSWCSIIHDLNSYVFWEQTCSVDNISCSQSESREPHWRTFLGQSTSEYSALTKEVKGRRKYVIMTQTKRWKKTKSAFSKSVLWKKKRKLKHLNNTNFCLEWRNCVHSAMNSGQAALVIHRTGAPRLWWGHSHRVNRPLPHTVPVSQTSHDHSSAPSTKPIPWPKIRPQRGRSESRVRVHRVNFKPS